MKEIDRQGAKRAKMKAGTTIALRLGVLASWRFAALFALAAAGCAATPPSLAERARSLRDAGDRAAAYAAYADALCAEPKSLDVVRARVELWSDLGRPGEPLAGLACTPPAGASAYAEGLAAAVRADPPLADAAFARAELALPASEHPEVWYRRGLAALGNNDARPWLDKAAAAAPMRVDVRLAAAQAELLAGDHDRAHADLTGVLALAPTPVELRRARGVMAALVRATEPPLAPETDAAVKSYLGALERGEATQDLLTTALALTDVTAHPRVATAAGLLALALKADATAERLLDAATAASRFGADAPRALGVALMARDRTADALPHLITAAARDPFDPEVQRLLAGAAASRGELRRARDAYRTLTVLEPTVVEHHLWLARMERQLGDLLAARRAVERGCVQEPRDVELLVERASIETQLTKLSLGPDRPAARARAMAAVDALLAVAPEHPAARSLLDTLED